jgi:hypothetical protein
MGYSFARRGCRESRIPLIADMDEYRIPISVVDPKSTRAVDAEKPPRLDPGDFELGTSKPRELWKLRSGTWSRHRRSFVFWIDFFIRRDEPSERVAADMSQLLRPPTTDEQVARALRRTPEPKERRRLRLVPWQRIPGIVGARLLRKSTAGSAQNRRVASKGAVRPQKITSLNTAFAAPSLGELQRNSWRLFSYAELFLLSS